MSASEVMEGLRFIKSVMCVSRDGGRKRGVKILPQGGWGRTGEGFTEDV